MLSLSNDLVLAHSNEIALELYFDNPLSDHVLDRSAKIKYTYSYADLFKTSHETVRGFQNGPEISIVYWGGVFILQTRAPIDIFLKANIPATAIHVQTRGSFAFMDKVPIKDPLDMFVAAKSISLDVEIQDANVLMLHAPNHAIKVKKKICTKRLLVNAGELTVKAPLCTGPSHVECEKLTILENGGLEVNIAPTTNRPPNGQALNQHFGRMHQAVLTQLARIKVSLLDVKHIMIDGTFNINNTVTTGSSVVYKTNSKSKTACVGIFADDVLVEKGAEISGNHARYEVRNNLEVHGDLLVNFSIIMAPRATITGVVWGKDLLHAKIDDIITVTGILGAQYTHITTKYLHANAYAGERRLFRGAYHQGGIIGEQELHLHTVANSLIAGAYIYTEKLVYTSGVNIRLLGYVRSFNVQGKPLLNLNLGLNVPSRPNKNEVLSWDTLARVALMTASNLPPLRVLVSAYELAGLVTYTGQAAIATLPVLAKKAAQALTAVSAMANPNTLATQSSDSSRAAIMDQNQKDREPKQGFFNSMLGAISDQWDQTKGLELVATLLKAQDLYIAGNAIKSHAGNVSAFALENVVLPSKQMYADALSKYVAEHGSADFIGEENFAPSLNFDDIQTFKEGLPPKTQLSQGTPISEHFSAAKKCTFRS